MKNILFFLFVCTTLILSAQGVTYFCPPCGNDCDLHAYEAPGQCEHCHMELVQRTEAEQLQIMDRLSRADEIKVAIYIHEGMEILDFAGPVEVFSQAGMQVYTVGLTEAPILSQGVVRITPEYTLDNCPAPNIIVFLGGNGWNASENTTVQQWLTSHAPNTDHLFSVCTGAFFLGKAGFLDNLTVTTFHAAIERLQELVPSSTVLSDARFVDNGKVITTAGISAGIDGALHLVSKLFGPHHAQRVARHMEYDKWTPEAGVVVEQQP